MRGVWMLTAFLLLGAGCATPRRDTGVKDINLHQVREVPKLIVTRDSSGVRMEFLSRKGVDYRIQYRQPGATERQTLPGADRIAGTGGLIKLRDPHPQARTRRYRLIPLVRPEGIPLR